MKKVGVWDSEKIDNPKKNWMHPKNLMKDEDLINCYGDCHKRSDQWVKEFGGKRYQTSGGEHSIVLKDNIVFDPVRKKGKRIGMPLDEYLEDTPFEFIEAEDI